MKIFYNSPAISNPLEQEINALVQDCKIYVNSTYQQYQASPYFGCWIFGNDNANQEMILFKNAAAQLADQYNLEREPLNQWVNNIYSASKLGSLHEVLTEIENLKSYIKKSFSH
ncbi:MAG: hypothetical protein HC820_05150 [Hydrococcus sp. RM1_1_31]|nr:hypothetical protein [Hydrococcus sp. RM1_1_31]